MSVSLDALARHASAAAVALAAAVSEGDVGNDRTWRAQVGPSLSQRDTARLLDRSEQAIAGRRLHRIHRAERSRPWWFGSVPGEPGQGGRFDLPAPDGACHMATSPAGAALEAFQDFGRGLLAVSELRARARAEVAAPHGTPPAAQLTAARSRSAGVTAALWSSPDRPDPRPAIVDLDASGLI